MSDPNQYPNTTAPPAETLGQPAQKSYEKGDPMAIVIPPPVAVQCPATTVDRATDEETRCILTIGHEEQRHTDGCMTWGDAVTPRHAIHIEPTPHRWVCFVDGRPENWYGETPELALQAMRECTSKHKENDNAT